MQQERRLILIRHSLPVMRADVPAARWALSPEGQQRCKTLAEVLRTYTPEVVVTSREPKAVETGDLIAERLAVPVVQGEGLHEHDRRNVELFPSRAEFESRVARFFAAPEVLIFGQETADEAHARFAAAVHRVMASRAEENVAIVTHGTVMTLYVSRVVGLEPLPFWRSLGLPALVVLTWPALHLDVVRSQL